MLVLKFIFGAFALIGALDRILGNRLKLGEEFEKGIVTVGTLAFAMVGMICIAPTIASLCIPIFTPFCEMTGIDLSFLGGFIANDMGGASLSRELASSKLLGAFHGLVVASMMGVTISFTIPVALKMTEEHYKKDVLLGILSGVATIPVGTFVSGFIMKVPFTELILNLLPVIVLSVVTCLGLVFKPDLSCKIFSGLGIAVASVIIFGLAVGVFEYLTGITLIESMATITEGFDVVVDIAIVLSGVFPLIAVISKAFNKLFVKIGDRAGLDEASVLGFVSSVANSIPTFGSLSKMNSKGRILNMAFAVSSSFVFGDHLAFTIAFNSDFVLPVVIGKLVSGITAVIVAAVIAKKKCA